MLADGGIGEWGFAAVVEADGRRILFDTGARPETVLRNAQELKVDLASITDVILSHNHADHTGGLLTLRRELRTKNPAALSRAHVGKGIFLSRPAGDGAEGNHLRRVKADYEALGGRFVEYSEGKELFPGAWFTGPVKRTHPEKNWSTRNPLTLADGTKAEDNLPEDSSLVLNTARGLVVVAGCGHAGIINTLEQARRDVRNAPIHAAIGGFHLFNSTGAHLEWTAGKLKEMGIENFLGAHCTGIEAVYRIRQLTGLNRRTCAVGSVGGGFSLAKGLDPGAIAR
jgi:7,8-dihydropterin-6-yl-methyl-4-(beta-D-ribofuranosyl)aminobenzene 5'-phosphate synthase